MILLEYKSGRITFKKTFYKGKYKCFEVKCDCGKEKILREYDFRKQINRLNDKTKPLTGKYKIPSSMLLNRQTGEKVNLDEILFTGQLTESDDDRNLKYTIVDKVWLLMKSIFEERTFSFSENGIIIEHK